MSITKKSPLLLNKLLICIATGFASGLPLYLLLSLIPAWLRTEEVDLKAIGLMALIQLPYTVKFLWAPFLDAYSLPFLGRRRGWMLVTQVALFLIISMYGFFNPRQDLWIIVALCGLLTFFSATADVVIDAFRREILSDNELGLGNSIFVNSYRIASLIPGSLSLVLADHFSWELVFITTALFMLPGIVMVLIVKEPPVVLASKRRNIVDTFIIPFQDFFTRQGVKHALLVLIFIILYKMGDSMATALATPFYLDMGYSKTDIGLIAKNAGLFPAIIFGIVGGIAMLKIGINKALWLFGLVQIMTILGFVWLASFAHFDVITWNERLYLGLVVGAEYTGVGLGTAAYVAYIARETNPLYTATQLAILTSLSAVPRTFVNASAGYLIEWMGYINFYWLCFCLAIPGMLILYWVAPWNDKGTDKGNETSEHETAELKN